MQGRAWRRSPDRRVNVPIASIAEIVMSEYAHILMVSPYAFTSRSGENPINRPEMIAAINMPEPV
jgi:hypothetical protein